VQRKGGVKRPKNRVEKRRKLGPWGFVYGKGRKGGKPKKKRIVGGRTCSERPGGY